MIKNIKKLNQIIKESGLSQQDLAKQLEVKQPTISRWFSGERQLPIKYFFKIVDIICLETKRDILSVLNEFITAEDNHA